MFPPVAMAVADEKLVVVTAESIVVIVGSAVLTVEAPLSEALQYCL